MDSHTYKKLEYIASGSSLTQTELNEVVELMDEYAREHVTEALRIHSVVRGGDNEAVIVHGDTTITNDQSQTTTPNTPTEPLPAEGSAKGVRVELTEDDIKWLHQKPVDTDWIKGYDRV